MSTTPDPKDLPVGLPATDEQPDEVEFRPEGDDNPDELGEDRPDYLEDDDAEEKAKYE